MYTILGFPAVVGAVVVVVGAMNAVVVEANAEDETAMQGWRRQGKR